MHQPCEKFSGSRSARRASRLGRALNLASDWCTFEIFCNTMASTNFETVRQQLEAFTEGTLAEAAMHSKV